MRIVICDSQSLFAQAVAFVLTDRGHAVVDRVPHVADLLASVQRHDPDACLVEPADDPAEAASAIRQLREQSPDLHIVIMSDTADADTLRAAAEVGVKTFASKSESLARLCKAVEDSKQLLEPVEMTRLGSGGPNNGDPDGPLPGRFLTPREREVLEHLVDGASSRHIAESLGIAYSTARTHVQNLITKLGVHSKLEVVALAINESIVAHPMTEFDVVGSNRN